MEITYVVSQYPARSETFIAREMQELVRRNNDVTIGRLRWTDTDAGLAVNGATLLPLHSNPLGWLLGIGWGLRHAPDCVAQMVRDLRTASPGSGIWWRLLIIALISLSLSRSLSAAPPDHIRAHFLDSESIAAHWMSRLLGVPYSITVHTRTTRFPDSLLQHIAENASVCVAVSHEVKEQTERFANLPRSVCLIRNGIRIPNRAPSRPSPSPEVRLLAVGRLIEKKGFDTLLDACALVRSWLRPVRCTIIGDGPLRAALLEQARTLHLSPYVTFRGAQPNDHVLRALHQHDLLVMPSRPTDEGDRDGIPTVLIEAMAHETFVVASDFAGIPELVDHNVTGRLVPPGNPVALARTLAASADQPRARSRMETQGRRRIKRDFNLVHEVGTLQSLLHRVEERPPVGP